MSLTDQILQSRKAAPDTFGEQVNVVSQVWDFPQDKEYPKGLPLIGQFMKEDTISMKAAQVKGLKTGEEEKGRRSFKTFIFKHLERGSYHSLAGNCLEQAGLIVGHYYIIDPPVATKFRSTERNETNNYKDYPITDITEQIKKMQSAK